MWAACPRRREFRPKGDDHKGTQRWHPVYEQVERLSRGGVAPVNILPNNQHRLTRRQALDLHQLGMERFLLALLWGEVQRQIAVACRDRQQVRQQRNGLTEIIGSLGKNGLQLVQALIVAIVASEPGRPFELRDARVQGAVLVVRRAEMAQSGMLLAA